ncbi:MAG TPA: thioredoxin domain-containing protein [Coleofasciculaceae cyanobacterium]|jgi:thiol-disulfide isomerase/thioredoxin
MDSTQPKRRFYFLAGIFIILFFSISFLLTRFDQPAASASPTLGLISLREMAQQSLPYESAMTNGKPTLVEFYADWCTSCQSVAPSIAKFHEQYGSQVNFVMLDVDDPQWRPQMEQYQVMGVPQFFFMSSDHTVLKTLVGGVPESILARLFEQLVNSV